MIVGDWLIVTRKPSFWFWHHETDNSGQCLYNGADVHANQQQCQFFLDLINNLWLVNYIHGFWLVCWNEPVSGNSRANVMLFLLPPKLQVRFWIQVSHCKVRISDIFLYHYIFNMFVEWKINEMSPQLYQLFHLIFECDVIVVNQTPISLVNPLIL